MKTSIEKCDADWDPVFISNRQKGILAAVDALYPNRGHRFCVRHIVTNTEKATSKLSPLEQSWIFKMARSECENDYKFYRSNLADTRPKAAEYLDGIPKEHRITYVFNETYIQPSYDEVTSNLSEAATNWLGNACRSSYPLHAFEQYFIEVVEMFAERRRDALRGVRARTPNATLINNTTTTNVSRDVVTADLGDEAEDLVLAYKKRLNKMLALTKSLHITPCMNGTYMMRFTDVSTRPDHAHLWRTVNLVEKECTCRTWQDQKFPCVHAVKAAIHHGMHVTELFDGDEYSANASEKHTSTNLSLLCDQ